MEDRFAANAQLAKARWLAEGRRSLLKLGLGEDMEQPDLVHRVLCMLYHLSRDPLHAVYHPPRPRDATKRSLAAKRGDFRSLRLLTDLELVHLAVWGT